VTSNRRGRSIHAQLATAGIPPVFTGVLSVLTSPAAEDWRKLLMAIDRPKTGAVRVAALTDLVGWALNDPSPPTGRAGRSHGRDPEWGRCCAATGRA